MMKLFLVVCLLSAVYAEKAREASSFYGLRGLPGFHHRGFIPSSYYPNNFYSPYLFPGYGSRFGPRYGSRFGPRYGSRFGLRRVYRSSSDEPMDPEAEVKSSPLSEDISEIEKRSLRKKIDHLPKWKADIILNLFGKGTGKGKKLKEKESFFAKFRNNAIPAQPRSLEEEGFLGDLLEPEEGQFDEEEEREMDEAMEDMEDEELIQEILEEMDEEVEEDEEDPETTETVKREADLEEEGEVLETILVKMPGSRRRRSVLMPVYSSKEEETEEEMGDAESDMNKRSAFSPYSMIEEQEEDASVYSDAFRGRRESEEELKKTSVVEEGLITFEDEEQPQKRSVYSSPSSSSSSPSVSRMRPSYRSSPRISIPSSTSRLIPSEPQVQKAVGPRTSMPRGDGYSQK